MKKLVVIKIGGYYIYDRELAKNIITIANKFKVSPIFVCGGGVFANAVREAYLAHGFSSKVAHYAAIKAMEISALIFSENIMNSVLVDSLDEILAWSIRGKYPVVLPYNIVFRVNVLPESWEVTGDSIASLIAVLLGVRKIVFVKKIPGLEKCFENVCRLVDKYACELISKYKLRAIVVNGDDLSSITSGFINV